MNALLESELILNPDGSIYHLNLHPEQVATTILTVGDPDRVAAVSKYFDKMEHKVKKREFVTHTGWLGKKRLTVISTGIGTDNIDIVLNELDALVNIDLQKKVVKEQLTQLDIIRVGTSGSLSDKIPVDAFVISEFAIGIDNLMTYYDFKLDTAAKALKRNLQKFLKADNSKIHKIPYVTRADKELLKQLEMACVKGITLTCSGFYAPQGRQLRAKIKEARWIQNFMKFNQQDFQFRKGKEIRNWLITNMEMETAGIYGMANMLGHRAVSFNAILANRATGHFSKKPQEITRRLIEHVLEKVSEI